MITDIEISNFRSISDQKISLKKMNILYGPNGSGKSSVLYAPYVLRNLFVNPNQKLNNLFNLGFINLGTYEDISKETDFLSTIRIGLTSNTAPTEINSKDNIVNFALDLYPSGTTSTLQFKIAEFNFNLEIPIPYTLSEKIEINLGDDTFLWNGFTFENFKKKNKRFFTYKLNTLYEDVLQMEMISVKRGFFSPIFSTELNSEEATFAMQIRDENLDYELKIDKYFNSIFGKHFRFVAIPGSTSFYLRTHSVNGKAIDLVNEGFGINQTIYMLIKLLKSNTKLAFIEEPEIHLHPSAQGKLIDAFIDIINEEKKQIFLTTHSEIIVSAVLAKIASQELDKNDVQFFLAENKNGNTKITPQVVNDKGQIEGGLLNFMETELSNLKRILGI